jgi:hypothetical protein
LYGVVSSEGHLYAGLFEMLVKMVVSFPMYLKVAHFGVGVGEREVVVFC